jgi:hypothetical protein
MKTMADQIAAGRWSVIMAPSPDDRPARMFYTVGLLLKVFPRPSLRTAAKWPATGIFNEYAKQIIVGKRIPPDENGERARKQRAPLPQG